LIVPADACDRHIVNTGDLLWTPGQERIADANVTHFIAWLARTRGKNFTGYDDLWQWSVTDTEGFWQAIWDYNDIAASAPPRRVLDNATMPGAQWFPGARLNYAEHVLRNERTGEVALCYQSEKAPLAAMTWDELAAKTRALATRLRELGIGPGDRVASTLPNTPEAVIAMLAATSIGAVWTSCSPDYGWRGALDRFRQLRPKILFCVGGYRYAGGYHDRGEAIREIVAGLQGLERTIKVSEEWDELVAGPAPGRQDFVFHQAAFGDPLWILFSSGTTGLPKAITHSHGGILLEQMKLQRLQMDLRRGDVMFFYTTTGWMMWNFLVSSLLIGARPLLYDGSPGWPEPDALWQIAAKAGVTFFGASPAYLEGVARHGIVPRERHDLSAMKSLMLAGSPVSAQTAGWIYENVKRDLYLHVGSGGTDMCTGFTGGAPVLPVYAGEHQRANLGVAAYAFNSDGEPVTDEVGEMVITRPMPSMPVFLWGDEEFKKYRETYFDEFPGIWRQGDFFKVNARGGCFVLGRSDATLNRFGVRIGTAEIYAVVNEVPEVEDSLVVNLDFPNGRASMPLFIKLSPGAVLDDALADAIRNRLRQQYSPRHVPDAIVQVPAIPTTLTGKKMEVPVRKILLGVPPEQAVNTSAMADATALDAFIEYALRLRADNAP
jgi:acetoacetyl-CoA synthetase